MEDHQIAYHILPDEGVSVEQVLRQEDILSLITDSRAWEKRTYIMVNLALPKFDVAFDMDLKEELKQLGVVDVFDREAADFTVMTAVDGAVYVSGVEHAARVMIDEEGCTAVAYTVIPEVGDALPPEEEVDFVLDRPFLFVITGDEAVPLFAGVVNQP